MKYSDSVKAILPAAIDGLAADPEKYAKRPGRDFTRNRKPGFKQLILMLLTMEGGNASARNFTHILAAARLRLPKLLFISNSISSGTGPCAACSWLLTGS